MGYYSTIDINVKVLPQHIAKVREIVSKEYNNYKKEGDSWKFWFCPFDVTDDGSIEFGDYNAKFYKDSQFAEWLKEFCSEGTITFDGEDETGWGYEFDGKGRLRLLEKAFIPKGKWL